MKTTTHTVPPVASTDLFGWVECSERLPADFDHVLVHGSGLGCFVGSIYKGKWRVNTPLNADDGRRIMIELDGGPRLPQPERWMPLPPHQPKAREPSPEKEDDARSRAASWDYCPECGSLKHSHFNGYDDTHRYCVECNQEWHTDIDYSDVVKVNLRKAISEIKRIAQSSNQ